MSQDKPAERERAEDHDLLTFGEAGARLEEELSAQQKLVAELESATDTSGLAAARARLAALSDALERNQGRRIRDEDLADFFGHRGGSQRGP